jgi:IclR family pca regulon transcriptional regulator
MPAFLGVLDGLDVVFIARASPQARTLLVGVGGRLPAFTSSSGRVLLASKRVTEIERMIRRAGRPRHVTLYTKTESADILNEIEAARIAGHAVSDKEVNVSSRALSVPVVTPAGNVAAAITLVEPAGTSATAKKLLQALPMLRRASQALGNLL